jgi:hypothetical protein
LRDAQFGELTPEDARAVSRLCDWALSRIYEEDQAAFRQYLQWVLEIDPTFVPQHSAKLWLVSRILGYESAEGVASAYRKVRAWIGAVTDSQAKPAA